MVFFGEVLRLFVYALWGVGETRFRVGQDLSGAVTASREEVKLPHHFRLLLFSPPCLFLTSSAAETG